MASSPKPLTPGTPAALHAATQRRDSTLFLPMLALPGKRRKALLALYDFCRIADDAADTITHIAQARAALFYWREEILQIYAGREATHAITRALAAVIREYGLRKEDFLAMLDGFAMDLNGEMAAPDLARVQLYCDRVAAAVGYLALPIFGVRLADAKTFAHHLAHGLQSINILRDVAADAAQGRCYLPREFLARHGITALDSKTLAEQPDALRLACEDMARLGRHHFALARAHMPGAYARKLFPALFMMALYEALLQRLEREGWPWRNPPAPLPWRDHIRAGIKALNHALSPLREKVAGA